MVKLSIRLFFAGLIVSPVLINLIGFLSPLWALFVLNDGYRSHELLSIFQPYAPLASILFALSIFCFSKIDDRKWVKALCSAVAITAVVTSFYGFIDKDSFLYLNLMTVNGSMKFAMLFLAGTIILKKSNILEKTSS